jgi:hypothetical protein
MIVVPTDGEMARVLDLLKELYDAGSHNFDYAYRKRTLLDTRVVSLEQLSTMASGVDLANLRLEDLPSHSIQAFEQPVASPELIEKVKLALRDAHAAAESAVEKFMAASGGHVKDICGWADVVVYDSQSPIVSALLALNETHVTGGLGYRVSDFGRHGRRRDQALSVAEAAVDAALTVLRARFPQVGFGAKTTWD